MKLVALVFIVAVARIPKGSARTLTLIPGQAEIRQIGPNLHRHSCHHPIVQIIINTNSNESDEQIVEENDEQNVEENDEQNVEENDEQNVEENVEQNDENSAETILKKPIYCNNHRHKPSKPHHVQKPIKNIVLPPNNENTDGDVHKNKSHHQRNPNIIFTTPKDDSYTNKERRRTGNSGLSDGQGLQKYRCFKD